MHNEIVAVFTTSNARSRLYNMLNWLVSAQVVYCDTGSVMFLCDENNPSHKAPYGGSNVEDATNMHLIW